MPTDRTAYKKEYYRKNADRIKAEAQQWRSDNPEKVRASKSQYYAKNKKRENKACAAYHKKNKAKIKLRKAAWRLANIDERRAKEAAYSKAHPENVRRQNVRRKARKKKAIIGDTKLIIEWELSWKSKKRVKCYWCRGSFTPSDCHSDHIQPLAKKGEHSVTNLAIACSKCNLRKHASPVAVWNQTLADPVLL